MHALIEEPSPEVSDEPITVESGFGDASVWNVGFSDEELPGLRLLLKMYQDVIEGRRNMSEYGDVDEVLLRRMTDAFVECSSGFVQAFEDFVERVRPPSFPKLKL